MRERYYFMAGLDNKDNRERWEKWTIGFAEDSECGWTEKEIVEKIKERESSMQIYLAVI